MKDEGGSQTITRTDRADRVCQRAYEFLGGAADFKTAALPTGEERRPGSSISLPPIAGFRHTLLRLRIDLRRRGKQIGEK